MHHVHRRRFTQTTFSVLSLLIFGGGLYIGLSPNLVSWAEKAPYDVFDIVDYRLPTVDDKEGSTAQVIDQENIVAQTTRMPGDLFSYFVTQVVDGNTLIVDGDTRLRLIGIKAPDRDEEMGGEATEFLRSMLEGREIGVYIDTISPRDDFGRLRGIVYRDTTNVNIEMLRAGLVHIFPSQPSSIDAYEWTPFEEEARLARRGLWGGESYYNGFVDKLPEVPVL